VEKRKELALLDEALNDEKEVNFLNFIPELDSLKI
jgi:hypothetical protein